MNELKSYGLLAALETTVGLVQHWLQAIAEQEPTRTNLGNLEGVFFTYSDSFTQ